MFITMISAGMNYEIEQETLSSGAMCLMKNHVEPNDLNLIWNHSFKYFMNGNIISM